MNFTLSAFTFLLLVANEIGALGKQIRKRQIYREQVLPHKGGKIPDTAFHSDRLALNRLQKEGIAIPDGVILEQRNPKVHPYPINDLRPVFKVYHTSDDRYTPSEGQYLHYVEPGGTAETTYPIPKFTDDTLYNNFIEPPTKSVYHPIYKKFTLPSLLLKNSRFKSHAASSYFASPQTFTYTHQLPDTPYAAQLNAPYAAPLNSKLVNFYPKYLTPQKWKYYNNNYFVPQYLKDFPSFFNPFDNSIPHH